MDNFDTPENFNNVSQPPDMPTEEELSHSDKMIGVFTEPKNIFEKMAQFPPKTIDWFLPMILLLLLVIVTQIIVLNNNEIYYQVKQKQIERTQEMLQDAVAKGQLTKEQAEQRLNAVEDQLAMGRKPVGMIIQSVSILIMGFVFFFIVTGVYFLFARFAFKGQGTYTSALVANGMTAYIAMIQVVLAAILSFAFGRMINDISIASLINADKTTFVGFILGKLDIITIWAYIILSIGLAKMFRSKSTGKFYALVFGLWIIWGLIIFFVGKAVPTLRLLS